MKKQPSLLLFVVTFFSCILRSHAVSVGDRVKCISSGLNIRASASVSSTRYGQANNGNTGSVISGPANSGGYTWWKISWDSPLALSGWSVDYSGGSTLQTISVPTAQVAQPVISPGSQSTTNSVTVSISCATTGATIRYTTNGSDPSSSSTAYGGSFTLSSSATVKARAFKNGMTESGVASAAYSISVSISQVAPPVINPGSMSTPNPITVSISCPTNGATIRYTLNGSDPNSSSTAYTGSFTLSSSATVKARGFKNGMTESTVASQTYTVSVPAIGSLFNNSPVTGLNDAAGNERAYKISVPSGQSFLEIKTTGGSGDADLYVRLGARPTTANYGFRSNGGDNTETVTISNSASGDWHVVVRAYNNYSGLTLSASYASVFAQVVAPIINPENIVTPNPITVSMTCATSGATIRYTSDGSTPTSASPAYGGSFILNSSATVNARGFKNGMTESQVASATYIIVPPSVTVLTNNIPATGLSGPTDNERMFKISVPAGQPALVISLSGGAGDADVYVQQGTRPTTSNWFQPNGRPYLNGNNETVTISNPGAGDWYIMVRAYSAYDSLTLRAAFSVDLVTKAQAEAVYLNTITPGKLTSLNECLRLFEINSPNRIRHFLAQSCVESSGLTAFVEWDTAYNRGGWFYDISVNPVKAAQLGNTEVGDGPKFKGCGAIQVTGRYNFQKFSDKIRPEDPKIMSIGVTYVSQTYPFQISGSWWVDNSMNARCDQGLTPTQISKAVNLGNPYSTGTLVCFQPFS